MPAVKVSNKYRRTLAVLICLCQVLLFAYVSYAEIYSWTDETGSMHFTDSPESIPKKYQGKSKIRDDDNSRTWEYLASDYGVDYYYDTANVSYLNRNRFRVMIKESYANTGREEYETQIILDCARQMYKPTQSMRIYKKQRSPVENRGSGDENGSGGYQDGYRRFTHPFLVLSRMVCRDKE